MQVVVEHSHFLLCFAYDLGYFRPFICNLIPILSPELTDEPLIDVSFDFLSTSLNFVYLERSLLLPKVLYRDMKPVL